MLVDSYPVNEFFPTILIINLFKSNSLFYFLSFFWQKKERNKEKVAFVAVAPLS